MQPALTAPPLQTALCVIVTAHRHLHGNTSHVHVAQLLQNDLHNHQGHINALELQAINPLQSYQCESSAAVYMHNPSATLCKHLYSSFGKQSLVTCSAQHMLQCLSKWLVQ